MDSIQLNLNKRLFVNIFHSMDYSDKMEIYDELCKSLSPVKPAKDRRKLGVLEGKASFREINDGKITENEFLGQ